jgi:hypothetical protein
MPVKPSLVLFEGGPLDGQTLADDTYLDGGVHVGQQINPWDRGHFYVVTADVTQNERFLWCRVARFVRTEFSL